MFWLNCLIPFLVLGTSFSFARPLSVHQMHPLASQHLLPAPETPGWSSPKEISMELSEANFWNAESQFTNTKNGKTLSHVSDFEQTALFLNYNQEISENWAWGAEAPFYLRYGGSLQDSLIDNFHKLFLFSRYNRNQYPQGRYLHYTETDGVRKGPLKASSGIGNLKFKIKNWFVRFRDDTGIAWSTHIKVPVEKTSNGMTSGSLDISQMLHMGFPMGSQSQIYFNLGMTYVHKNWMYADWPLNKFLWMGDMTVESLVMDNLKVFFSLSAYSPLMKKKHLEPIYPSSSSDLKEQNDYLMASGYNGFVKIRGHQTIGVRFLLKNKIEWSLYALEDWWFGGKEINGDPVYSHNQPDIGIGTQISMPL